MIVELVGASGIGKSHLVQKLYVALRSRGIEVFVDDGVPFQNVRISTSLLIMRAAIAAVAIRPRTFGDLVYASKEIARYLVRHDDAWPATSIRLSSEGLFHRLRAFQRRSRGISMSDMANRLFRVVPTPEVVIVLEADARTVYSRRYARSSFGDEFTRSSVEADVMLTKECFATIIFVQERIDRRIKILRLDLEDASYDQSLETAVRFLEDRLSEIT